MCSWVCSKVAREKYSRWHRETASRAWLQWYPETKLSQVQLGRLLAVSDNTVARLEHGALPTPEMMDRLIELDIIDERTAEPNMVMARQLRALEHQLPSKGNRYARCGLSNALSAWRKAQGLTLPQAAQRIGVAGSAYGRWERGNSLPAPTSLVRLVKTGAVGRELAERLIKNELVGSGRRKYSVEEFERELSSHGSSITT